MRSMQNIVRWHSNQLDGTVVARYLGAPWSNESDANIEDSGAELTVTKSLVHDWRYLL